MNKTSKLFLFDFQKLKPQDAFLLFRHFGLEAKHKASPSTHLALRDAYKPGTYEHGKKLSYLTALLANKILQFETNDTRQSILLVQTDIDFYWRSYSPGDLGSTSKSILYLVEKYRLLEVAHVLYPYHFILKFGKDLPLEGLDNKNMQQHPGKYFHETLLGILNNPLATTDQIIKEGRGEFGLCQENPIPLHGECAINDYLQRLKLKGTDDLFYYELSFMLQGNPIITSKIIPYKIYSEDKTEICTLYFSPYNWVNSTAIPDGFELSGTRSHAQKKPFELPFGWLYGREPWRGFKFDN